jgi:uncharacterized membrane protein
MPQSSEAKSKQTKMLILGGLAGLLLLGVVYMNFFAGEQAVVVPQEVQKQAVEEANNAAATVVNTPPEVPRGAPVGRKEP